MGAIWAVVSGSGGAGKSTACANLAVAFALMNKRVILIDANTGLRALDLLLGLENRAIYDLMDVADGVCGLKRALIRHPKWEGISLIAAAQARESGALDAARLREIAGDCASLADFTLIDAPPGVGRGFRAAAEAAEDAIVVTAPDCVARRDAEKLIGAMGRLGIGKPMLLVNRVLPEHALKGAPVPLGSIGEALGGRLIGAIPEQRNMASRQALGEPAASTGTAAGRAYRDCARRLIGEDVPLRLTPPSPWTRRFRALERK